MADHFTQFSCMFNVGTTENAAHAEQIRRRHADALEEQEGPDLGFDMEPDPDCGPGALWISSDGYGEPEHVIAFVLACAEAFNLTGRWGFTWALTCSKPRLDGFGGGAQLIDLGAHKSLAWLDCDHWLSGALDPAFDADTSVALSAAVGGEQAMGNGEGLRHDPETAVDPPRPRPTDLITRPSTWPAGDGGPFA